MRSNAYGPILLLLLFALNVNGQIEKPNPPADQIKLTLNPVTAEPRSPAGFVNPAEVAAGVQWDIKLSQKGGIRHSVDEQDQLEMIKAQKTAEKMAYEELNGIYPNPSMGTDNMTETVTPVTPVVLTSFEANGFDGWSPPDNDMAISDNGYIVSVINSAISYYTEDGTVLLQNQSFQNLLSGLDVTSFLFDPKVLYDPDEDRFILVVLSGNEPATSKVVVGFSVTENPMDGWWFYTFDGDYLQGNWFDFPNIGISESDLFISGNLFHPDNGFDQTVLLQIKKENGFWGGDVDWEYFNNVQNGNGGNAFTLVPASYGYNGSYGPGIFMVSNSSFGGNQVFLYEVTDSVNADQVINVYSVNTSFYDPAGDAQQYNTNRLLDTGGNRIRNAFYANGFVHFVFTVDVSNGYAGVRYNRLDVNNMSNEHQNFGISLMDCAYPSVAPYGLDSLSNAVMIGYLQSGSSIYPQIRAVNVDDDMTFSSSKVVKMGETAITTASGINQRWGDYSGGCRKHNADYPNAWFVGCYGQGNDYGNWIYEVSDEANGLPPIADFEASPKFGEVSLTSFFADQSINGAESFEWTFEGGDPATSSDPTVFVTYDDPGMYDAQLIVSNTFGTDTILKQNYISAQVLPVADFEADVTVGTAPMTVNFENLSSNINVGAWSFNGGDPTSTTQLNPTVVYNNPGTYTVQLTVINDFGSDVEAKFNYITVGTVGVDESDLLGDVKVFPNPVVDEFNLEFYLQKKTFLDISVVDVNGKQVKNLLHGNVKGGQNILSFNKNALTAGTYFLIVKDERQNIIRNEKIIVSQ